MLPVHCNRSTTPASNRVQISLGNSRSSRESTLSTSKNGVFEELLPTGLQELLDSDTTGESLHTLEVYLSTGGKKARAAELLYIHLNTLKYRISTLSAKLDADLDDPATMFSLSHALHIVRYLRCFGENA